MDPDGSNGKSGRNKAPVDFPCAVCGVFVHLDRWPKERQDVRCGSCQGACGSLLTGDDLAISAELAKARKEQHRGKYAGLPEMTEEDLEAVTEMRSLAERMGNGRSSNRKRGSGGRNKRRRGHKGSNSGGGGGGGGGGRRRRRRRGGGGGGGGGGGRG